MVRARAKHEETHRYYSVSGIGPTSTGAGSSLETHCTCQSNTELLARGIKCDPCQAAAALTALAQDARRYKRITRFDAHPFRISVYDAASSKWMADPPSDWLAAAIDAAIEGKE